MTEREYKIEVLCTTYSLDELKDQREKLRAGTLQHDPDMINQGNIMELTEAIISYEKEEYRLIREDMENTIKSLSPNTYYEYSLVLRKLLTDHYNFPVP